jgi:hypothetical protein
MHRCGNEHAWWQSQGIDPLPIAASFWNRTHAIAPADAEIVGDRDPPAGFDMQLNGRPAAVADWRQNDETKPIRGPEAE